MINASLEGSSQYVFSCLSVSALVSPFTFAQENFLLEVSACVGWYILGVLIEKLCVRTNKPA